MHYNEYQWHRFFTKLPLPKPQNDAEFAIVTEWVFGVALDVEWKWGEAYQIKQSYNSYHGKGFHFDKSCTYGYDRSSGFLHWALGRLYCGGIARSSYGQFNTEGHRDRRRIERWQESTRSGKTDGSTVRASYVRLASHCRERKSSEIRGVAAPIHGPGGWSHEGFERERIAA